MTIVAARRAEKSIYGSNTMRRFTSKTAYEAELVRLRASGAKVQQPTLSK